MFEKFHHDARAAVVLAKHEADAAGQPTISSEHLLLGLLAQPGPAADALRAAGVDAADLRRRAGADGGGESQPLDADALASLGIDLDAVRRATDAAFGRGALDRAGEPSRGRRRPSRPRMMPEVKRALERALHLAMLRRDGSISAAHQLLGILEGPPSPAVADLTAAGVDIAALQADVLRRMAAAA
jgi:ATP-dependent Clp protease ATP-binding subunit ClpA